MARIRQRHDRAFERRRAPSGRAILVLPRNAQVSEDAEDVVQEVFTAAFTEIRASAREIRARRVVARDRGLDELHRRTGAAADPSGAPTRERYMRSSLRRGRVLAGPRATCDLRQLPPRQRTALLLRELNGLSYHQSAMAMRTSLPAVNSLVTRARFQVRDSAAARDAAPAPSSSQHTRVSAHAVHRPTARVKADAVA
jgi:DNA-directed RNA polymerase specialized sigma24 family protein